MFGDDHIDKLAENYARTPATIDQSDIARLLALLMSTETSRRAAVTLDKAGFLERRKSPYQSMLVRSHGTLEDIFGAHIRHIRNAFANAAEKEAVR